MRLLAELVRLPVEPARMDVAERLGGWLGALDAVRLEAALQSVRAEGQSGPSASRLPSLADVQTDVQKAVRRERDALQAAVRAIEPLDPALQKLPPLRRSATETAAPTRVDYGAYHKRHVDLQRRMDLKVGQVRAAVRRALSARPGGLRELAALDAAMEQTLAARSDKLLAGVPVLLERRFNALRDEALASGQEPGEGGALDGQPAAWLRTFHHEWQEVLLAELDVRLQPVMGLMEALGAEVGKVQ